MNQNNQNNNESRKLIVVSASAGTGKTTQLTFNYLSKLAEEIKQHEQNSQKLSLEKLAQIINRFAVITFTNAASNQLKERIISCLKNPSEIKGAENEDQKNKICEVLGEYSKLFDKLLFIRPLRISTIHSFCMDIARALHSELALPPDIDFTEDEDLWETAIELYFHSVNNENIKKFISYVGYGKLKRMLSTVGKKYYFFVNTFGSVEVETNNNKINWPSLKEVVQMLKFEMKGINELKENEGWLKKILNAFSFITLQIGSWYEEMIRYKGIIDYDGILFVVAKFFKEKTNNLLNLLEQKSVGIKYLFVDEAQDNSFLQYFIVDKLVYFENPRIWCFVVGDIKQSIYHWREAYPELFGALVDLAKSNKNTSRLHDYRISSTSYRIKSKQLLDEINSLTRTWFDNGNGWKFYDSELTLTSGCEICDETDVGAEIPAYVEMNDIDDQERQERNEEFEKLIKNSTVGIIGRSRNSCKKVKDYVTTTSSEIFFRDRAGFDIKEEKEILWFDTILKLKTGETTSLQLLAMLELKQLLELNKEEKNTSTQEEKNNTSEEQNEKQKEGQKLLKEIIFKKDWILKLMNRVEDLVGQNVTLNYINTQRTITELLGSFILSEVTKNKIFNEQEHRNLLHFLSTLYTIEKRRDAYNLWYYKLIVSDLMEEQIYDTPSVWGQPQKGVVEVTTIHSAKGLEYDVVFFLEDDLEKLTKNDIDGSRLEKEIYPFEIEVENNNIQLLWSPVNIKKLISNKDVRKRIKNQQNSDILKTANKYIFSSIQENFNLAYVLITRAKRKIVKCTTDRKKKTAKNI